MAITERITEILEKSQLPQQALFISDRPGGLRMCLHSRKYTLVNEDVKFLPERHKTLGPDLATSHFIVKRGGAVKFVGRDTWFKMDENEKYYLPNRKIDGMLLEAIDASQTSLMHIAFDNFVDLKALRFLRLSDCPFIDDWCLIRLQQLKDSLEFLDISGCSRVTDHGLATLHHLEKLTALKMSNLPNVQNPQLMALLLEEATGCQVYGVDFNTDPDKDSKTNEKT